MSERKIGSDEYDEILSRYENLEIVSVNTGSGTLLVHTLPNTPPNQFVVKAHHGEISEYWADV